MRKNIILIAHGQLAQEMLNSVEMLSGKQPNLSFINLEPDMDAKDLNSRILGKLDKENLNLLLTDIPGGTPCNESLKISLTNSDVYLLSGMNVSMVLQAVLSNEEIPEKYIEGVLQASIDSVVNILKTLNDDMSEED